jgi:hypothetical protein
MNAPMEPSPETTRQKWPTRTSHLVPRKPDEWVVFGLALTLIACVLAWMWGSLVVLWEMKTYVLGALGLLVVWVGARKHRERAARRGLLAVLSRASEPLTVSQVLARVGARQVALEHVTRELAALVEQEVVVALPVEDGLGYVLVSGAGQVSAGGGGPWEDQMDRDTS